MPAPRILFAHTNFPAQFGFLGQRLARAGWDCGFATARKGVESQVFRLFRFEEGRDVTPKVHPYVAPLERAVIKGQQAARAMMAARRDGWRPDIVMAHSGWGAGMFAKDIFPQAVFIPYCEWWYRYPPVDSVFLGDHEANEDARLRQRIRNAPILIDLEASDRALAPTRFQAAQFPPRLGALLSVIHDGVDTAGHAPAPVRPERIGTLDLTAMPEIVTYATRGMEPQRGFPAFMRALAILQAARPRLHAIVVGEDRVAYGRPLPEGESWKRRMLAECALDPGRTHFTGLLPRPDYMRVLEATDAHVYLTAPFVLSWSMLEAMSTAVPLVASDVEPVREFVTHGETGLLADFHDPAAIAAAVARLLDNRAEAARLGAAARAAIVAGYDLETVFAQKRRWLEEALGARG